MEKQDHIYNWWPLFSALQSSLSFEQEVMDLAFISGPFNYCARVHTFIVQVSYLVLGVSFYLLINQQ